MKILVLGASGQVGSELGTQLENALSVVGQNYSLVLASRSEVDVADLPVLRDFLRLIKPDFVINASAYTAVDNAETEVSQAYRVNEHAVRVMAEHCAARPLLQLGQDAADARAEGLHRRAVRRQSVEERGAVEQRARGRAGVRVRLVRRAVAAGAERARALEQGGP